MEDGVIYTFGSLDTLVIILEGLARLFDPVANTFFVSDSGFGVGVGGTLAATLALLGVFTNYITQQKLVAHGPLVGLLVYALIAVPKIDRIFVSDLYTGETVAVSDVPLGIAIIGVTMSTITYNIIEESEQAYGTSAIAGSPYEAKLSQGQGFLSPMKTLFKLRQNLSPSTPSHLVYNMFAYSKYCLHASINVVSAGKPAGNPNFDMLTFKRTTHPLTTYFLEPDLIDGDLTTEMMDPTSAEQSFVKCETLNDLLADNAPGGIGYYLNDGATLGQHLLTQLASSDETMLSECSAGGACLDGTTAITDTKDIIGQILGGVAQSEAYMEARLATDFNNVIGLAPNLDAASLANATTMNRETIELVRLTEVLEGETFLRFMIPAMNSILFIFYATFPLAMVIMITKGADALKYLGGFMLIGVWAYSWMPIATVINLITISNVGEALNTSRNLFGINVASTPQLLELAMDQLATGSNLLAATPIITLAIISGSLYALTSVAANSAAPSGAAGGVARANTPSGHTGSSMIATQPAYSDKQGLKTAGAMNQHAAAIAGSASVSSTQNWDSNTSALNTQQAQQEQKFKQMLGNMLSSGTKTSSGSGLSGGVGMTAETREAISRLGAQEMQKAGVQNTGKNKAEIEAVNFAVGGGIAATGSIRPGFIADMAMTAADNVYGFISGSGAPDLPNSAPNAGQGGSGAGNTTEGSDKTPGKNNNANKGGKGLFDAAITGEVGINGSFTDQTVDTFSELVSRESRTTRSDRVSDEDSAANTRSVPFSESDSFGLENNAQLTKMRNLSSEMAETASEIAQFQTGSSTGFNFSDGRSMTLKDTYSTLSQSSSSNGQDFNFHENRLRGMMRDAGFDDNEINQGVKLFNQSRDAIKKDLYSSSGNGPDVNYYAGTDAYDHAASVVSSNTDGSHFAKEGRDRDFKSLLQVAGSTQFDFMDPNNDRSEQVAQVMQNIKNGSENPMFLSEERSTSVSDAAGRVEQQGEAGGMDTANSSDVLSTPSGQYTANQISTASSALKGAGFQPSRSPIAGQTDNLSDAYFSPPAKDAYANSMYGSNYADLKTDQQRNSVDARRANHAMADVADHNRYGSNYAELTDQQRNSVSALGYTGPQQGDLLKKDSSQTGYMREASGLINNAVQSGLNNGEVLYGANQASSQISAEDQATSNLLTEGQKERENSNPSGLSKSEVSGALKLAVNTDSPADFNQGWNAQYSQFSPNSLNQGAGGTNIIGTGALSNQSDSPSISNEGRLKPNSDKLYESGRVPSSGNVGNLEHFANTLASFGIQGDRATAFDKLRNTAAEHLVSDSTQALIKEYTGISLASGPITDVQAQAREQLLLGASEKIENRIAQLPDKNTRDQVRGQISALEYGETLPQAAQYISNVSDILQDHKQPRL